MFCQAQEVTSVQDAFRMIVVFAVRWEPKSERGDAKPFFPGALGPFSQRWRLMDAIADCTFTLGEAVEAVKAFYRDLPNAFTEKHQDILTEQEARINSLLKRRQESPLHS